MTTAKLVGLAVLSLVVAIGIGVYLRSEKLIYPPIRPNHLPTTAKWFGGLDGGDWLDCKLSGGAVSCTIYSDLGEKIASGKFVAVSGRRLRQTDVESLCCFDGSTILRIGAIDGEKLVAEGIHQYSWGKVWYEKGEEVRQESNESENEK